MTMQNNTQFKFLLLFYCPSDCLLLQIAPIEVSDASSVNLIDVASCKWDERQIPTCGRPELRAKIGPERVPGGSVLGKPVKR
jgi:sugar (pentulose or hexulose) kinase